MLNCNYENNYYNQYDQGTNNGYFVEPSTFIGTSIQQTAQEWSDFFDVIPSLMDKVKTFQENAKIINATNFLNRVIEDYQNIQMIEQANCKNSAKSKFSHFSNADTLESNLALAQEILNETINAVPFSPNYMARSEHILNEQDWTGYDWITGYDLTDLTLITNEVERRINQNRDSEELDQFDFSRSDKFKRTKASGKIAKNTLIGNCGEMSDLGLFIGMKKGAWNVLLEECTIENTNDDYNPKANHAFLVLGRKPGSDPKDYKTWGPTAVVVDTWAKKIYPVSEIELHLYDLDYHSDECNRTGFPNLRLFDPDNQTIKIFVGNIFPAGDLEKCREKLLGRLTDAQLKLYDKILRQLECFHQTKDLDKKLGEAEKLHNLCTNGSLRRFSRIVLLSDQVAYFIKLGQKANGIKF